MLRRPQAIASIGALLAVTVATATALLAPAAAVAAPGAPAAPSLATAVVPPPVNGTFDYQIGGAYSPARAVSVVDRDWHDRPAAGKYNICYVNAFQAQPEDLAWWKAHHARDLLRKGNSYVIDTGWNEVLLDTRSATTRADILKVVGAWIDSCRAKGYRAVELDNLDSETRSQGLITYAENRAMAAALVARAHRDKLAAAQKNDAENARNLKAVAHFDFAIAEECEVYGECLSYMSVYGRHLIEIEYTDNGYGYYTAACAARGRADSVIIRDRDVVPRGTSGYYYRYC